MSDVQSTEPTLPVEDRSLFFAPATIRNCIAAWLVPGLGYFLAGRRKQGIIIGVALFTGILLGVILGGDLYPLGTEESKIRMIGSFCQLGMGIPYMLSNLVLARGTALSFTYDYGTTYFLIAGMLNWLAVMDVFDISVGRK